MSYVRLADRSSLHRRLDGSTRISVGYGEALSFGPGFATLLDELRSGVPAHEWKQRLGADPMAARLDLALAEHRLLEQTAAPQSPPPPPPGHLPDGHCSDASWRLHCALTLLPACALAVAAMSLLPVQALMPLPWWGWAAMPFALMAMSLLHETGHYLMARLHGQTANIRMFQQGQLQARCVIGQAARPRTAAAMLRILAAGPWTDSALVAATAAATRAFAFHPVAAVTVLCALAGLIANVMPGKRSDYAKMLALAPYDPVAFEIAGWFVVGILAMLALAYLTALTGLARH